MGEMETCATCAATKPGAPGLSWLRPGGRDARCSGCPRADAPARYRDDPRGAHALARAARRGRAARLREYTRDHSVLDSEQLQRLATEIRTLDRLNTGGDDA